MVASQRCLERARPTPFDAHQFEGRPPHKTQPRASAPPTAPKRASGLLDAGPLPHLVRAADPYYPRKCIALFYEFQELGTNKQRGYSNPDDLLRDYPRFFWDSAYPHIKAGLKYLDCTASGRQWTANLFRHVFATEHLKELSD